MIDSGIIPEYTEPGWKYVLIVEKDPLQGYLLKMSLMEAGWAVRLVESPHEALLCCEYDIFDVAVINSHYPENANGYLLAKRLWEYYHLPTLMITSSRYTALKRSDGFNPMQKLLFKPYRLMECGQRLEQLLCRQPLLQENCLR